MNKIYPLAADIINTVIMAHAYNWSDSLTKKTINEAASQFNDNLRKTIKWDDITADNAINDYGFGIWAEAGDDTLYLIPLILLPIIPEGTELTSINNDIVTFHRDDNGNPNIDNDVRFGYLAYGVKLRKKDKSN